MPLSCLVCGREREGVGEGEGGRGRGREGGRGGGGTEAGYPHQLNVVDKLC